ncbi:hypothetical protein FALBO_6217 [Fusarium albosuccineum]|uniref:RRM domain-containing protein n=1 Tax=Fusarium albosuccineum TaxID=1237068 RepID=A0A8H4LF77_9HYPO|nr:hypothetical protein FALBO_6217 [Fusarium albosuccineum]
MVSFVDGEPDGSNSIPGAKKLVQHIRDTSPANLEDLIERYERFKIVAHLSDANIDPHLSCEDNIDSNDLRADMVWLINTQHEKINQLCCSWDAFSMDNNTQEQAELLRPGYLSTMKAMSCEVAHREERIARILARLYDIHGLHESVAESESPSSEAASNHSEDEFQVVVQSEESDLYYDSGSFIEADDSGDVGNVDDFSFVNHCNSRRVIIHGLFEGITEQQVCDAVCGKGGLLNIRLFKTELLSPVNKWSAMVEFSRPTSAKEYVEYASNNTLFFEDGEFDLHAAHVILIETASHPLPTEQAEACGADIEGPISGRTLEIEDFPQDAVWAAMEHIGLNNIVRANFEGSSERLIGTLELELVSIIQAVRVRKLISKNRLPSYSSMIGKVGFGMSPSDLDLDKLLKPKYNIVGFVESDHLERQWNVAPFNTFVPMGPNGSQNLVPKHTALDNIPRHPVPTQVKALKALNYFRLETVEEEEVPFFQEIGSTTYVIDGGEVYVFDSARDFAYQQLSPKAIVGLQDLTLQDPTWGGFWDKFCKDRNLPDLRRWDLYGKHAFKQRKLNAIWGLPASFPLVDIKLSPVPEVIRNYTSFSTFRIVQTNVPVAN